MPGEVGRKMLKIDANALLQIKGIFENPRDQLIQSGNSKFFQYEMDISGLERHVDRVTKRDPPFKMSAAYLYLPRHLLPSNDPLVVEFFIQLEWKMKVDGLADFQR